MTKNGKEVTLIETFTRTFTGFTSYSTIHFYKRFRETSWTAEICYSPRLSYNIFVSCANDLLFYEITETIKIKIMITHSSIYCCYY